MKLLDSLRIVWRNLWRMKLRTILTSVGVMIGTAAIVAMISLSLGLRENAVKSLENFGNLTEMDVQPAYMSPDGQTPIPPEQMKKLNYQAVQELKQIEGIESVIPVKSLQGGAQIKLGRREGDIQLMGIDVHESRSSKSDEIEKGTYLTGSANEIVVTYEMPRMMRDVEKERREARKRNASGAGSDPMMQGGYPPYGMEGGGSDAATVDMVGKTATLVINRQFMVDNEPKFEKKEIRVRVVGQLAKSDGMSRFGGNMAFVPLEMINELNKWLNPEGMNQGFDPYGGMQPQQKRTRSRTEQEEVIFDSITVKVGSREQVEPTLERVQRIGFEIYSPARALKEINQFFFVVQLILGGIAAISLLVASIGIINTMIMSILERTREIGIMKVIGATVYNIRWLFLIESGFIGLIGGISGLGLAWGAVQLLNYVARSNPEFSNVLGGGGPGGPEGIQQLAVVPLWLAGFAVGFAFLIGILAGIFPAFRASRLSPLQAIRSE
ncbi:ABC transporter permease [Brevibacillus dissolubilis]|uniref:ABC transporter permease n=1 Tax=Brevibacillus dissolubilis TaxID=1844116 RepID=UPI001115F42A|nr:ABC transporter permease [Brevibacillus dissolubilis]